MPLSTGDDWPRKSPCRSNTRRGFSCPSPYQAAAKTKKYVLSGDTNSFNATVNQSDGPTSDLNFVNQIAQEEVKIENGKKDDPLEITFSYDKSQNMHCTFLHVPSGTKHEIQIKNLSTKDVDKAKKEMNKFHIEY